MSRTQPSDLYAHPRQMVAEAVEDYGVHATVDTALALLEGHEDYDRLPVPLTYLAGVHAVTKLGRGDLAQRQQSHWPRMWAARALRFVWLDYAEPSVVAAVADPAWRVREMVAKVIGQRMLVTGADALTVLLDDVEPRVRVAGVRALGAVGRAEHAARVERLPVTDMAMRVAVDGALRSLRLSAGRSRTG